jgi:hypothetical protein
MSTTRTHVLAFSSLISAVGLGLLLLGTSRQILAQSGDQDGDGIDDQVEFQLASQFFPTVHWHTNEACPGPVNSAEFQYPALFRLRYLAFQGVVNTNYIGINYVRLFDQDCGPESHNGDNESFVVVIRFENGSWRFDSISATAHWGTACDLKTVSPNNELWIGGNKHGNYVYLPFCQNDYPVQFCNNECDATGPARSVTLFNVGEPWAPLIDNLGTIYSNWFYSPPTQSATVWNSGRFFDAGVITDQLYLSGYGLASHPPEINACYQSCTDQYNECLANPPNGCDGGTGCCTIIYSDCNHGCENFYSWDWNSPQ